MLDLNIDAIPTATTRVLSMPNADVALRKDNLAATTAPTVNDDSTQFYQINSRWWDTVTGFEYVLRDASAGAAVWQQVAKTNLAQTFAAAQTFDRSVLVVERVAAPVGDTASIDLTNSNHQTLDLTATTGDTLTTFTPPASASAGTIIIKQHATPRALTWAVTSGTILKATEPNWASATTLQIYVMSWRWDGSVLYLAAVEVS
jgi:hypothetical protein